tara:strand:- start:3145 stop:4743 length:1599 start_codon:yes stop_codon:yes gene_type:complete
VPFKTVFACDKDKYARKSYIANYGTPEYFPEDVYDREIPEKPLNIYMSSPPCQPFSLSGKREGEDDDRGILFYNTHEFIKENKPDVFIIENVKGLLSHDPMPNSKYGRTFTKWLQYLAGKSINGDMVFLPHEDAVPYHIHFDVLNAKDYGVPQNRERVFIVGIRDDIQHDFKWPKKQPLTKKLKDVLEDEVDPKYFLSDKMLDYLINRKDNFNNGKINFKDSESIASTLTKSASSIDISDNILKVECIGNVHPSGKGMNGNVFDEEGISPTLTTNKGEGIKIKSATSKGYELATLDDSINFSNPNSETRRGRVGKEVAQTLDTACNKGVIVNAQEYYNANHRMEIYCTGCDHKYIGVLNDPCHNCGEFYPGQINEIDNCECDLCKQDKSSVCIPVSSPEIKVKRQNGRRIKEDGDPSFTLTARDRHGVIIDNPLKNKTKYGWHFEQNVYSEDSCTRALKSSEGSGNKPKVISNYKIRRLTPRECLRLMDFPDSFKMVVSDTQIYKQAGNSIVRAVLAAIAQHLLPIWITRHT